MLRACLSCMPKWSVLRNQKGLNENEGWIRSETVSFSHTVSQRSEFNYGADVLVPNPVLVLVLVLVLRDERNDIVYYKLSKIPTSS